MWDLDFRFIAWETWERYACENESNLELFLSASVAEDVLDV